MDTEKLLRILGDIQKDEETLAISAKLDAIRNALAQNNQDGFTSAHASFEDLATLVKSTSISYSFSRTENIILENIGGEIFFGKGLVSRLEKVFGYKSFELLTKLDEYREQRNNFIKNSNKVVSALDEIGIEEYRPEEYEVGIVLPDEEGGIDRFQKRVHQLKILLSALAEATGKESEEIKINRVSNGTLELFSTQPAEVAVLLSTLLLNIGSIWDKISKFRKKISDTEKDKDLSPEGKKEIKDILKKEAEKIKVEILKELPEKCLEQFKKEDNGRRNEIRNQIGISIRAIFAWLEIGIEIDITPIRVQTEEQPTKKETERMAQIQSANSKLGEIYKIPIEERKLPFALPEPQVEKEVKVEKKPSQKKSKPKKKDNDGNAKTN